MDNSKNNTNPESDNDSLFKEMDPAILDDPILMLKWFESHELTVESPPSEDLQPVLGGTKKSRTRKGNQANNLPELLPDDIILLEDQPDPTLYTESCNYFFEWLSNKVNESSMNDIITAIDTIEKYSRKYGLIHSALLHVSDTAVIQQIQSLLVQKKEFRSLDLTLRYNCGLALRYYSQYLSEATSKTAIATPCKKMRSEHISISKAVIQSSEIPSTSEKPTDIITPDQTTYSPSNITHTNSGSFSSEQLSEQLQEINCMLSQHLSDINKNGSPAIAEAYHAYLTEKLKKAPEQIVSDAIRNLLFIIRSVETYNTLSNYEKYRATQSSNLKVSSTRSADITAISENLLQQGITPSWLYMHGLSTLDDTKDPSQLVDTSVFIYKKIKKGIRIDSVKSSGRIVIPDFIEGLPVIKIGESAFRRRKDITTVLLPKHLIEIEEYAFEKSGINSIVIPDSVEQIGQCAFRECKKLSDISLPQMLKTIKWNTFYGCSSIKAIKIPVNVATISDSAFSGCTKLKMVQIPDSVTRMESYIFSSSPVFYCNEGSRAFRYAGERWRWPKPKAYEAFDVDCISVNHKK